MKTPDEVRRDLNAAREAFKTRHAMFQHWGVTSGPWSMNEWRIQEAAAADDDQWDALLDQYVRDYERMLAIDAVLRADVRRWRSEGGG